MYSCQIMVLAIDASRAAVDQKTGVGWYCHHLLAHLKDVIPHDVRVVLYTDRSLPSELRPWPTNWEERILRWPPATISNSRRSGRDPDTKSSGLKFQISNSRWPLWSQIRLAWQVLRDRPDVLFVPAHVIPEILVIFSPSSSEARSRQTEGQEGERRVLRSIGEGGEGVGNRRTKLITTIHDVAFKDFPEAYSFRERRYADHATRLAVRAADRVIVPTRAVACDLERCYQCDPTKITVIAHGVELDSKYSVPMVKECSSRLATDDSRLVLYVGRLEYKKNVVRMIQAFERIASQCSNLQLVLAGQPGHGHEQVRETIDRSPVRDRIITLGWISREEYWCLLSRASVFLFPTLVEGFGLPILEAMAAGVPVIVSRGGAHEEVAGDAAVLVDPFDVSSIADATSSILDNVTFRSALVERGRQRAAEFTWKRSARATWEAINSVLSA
ncbi:MAG: glycosyltransferase family 1 protein [Candidatus Uhrbacteria bacterium]